MWLTFLKGEFGHVLGFIKVYVKENSPAVCLSPTLLSPFQGKDVVIHGRFNFPSAARQVESLKELLAASDVVSLHCSLMTETVQLLNAEALQHIKPGKELFIYGLCSFQSAYITLWIYIHIYTSMYTSICKYLHVYRC